MKVLLISILKFGLKVLYAPLKLFKSKDRIVYLSRQSNDKSIDMLLLERAIKDELLSYEQVFRLRMIPDGLLPKIKYCLGILGDMYYLATSKLAILDTYSITVSCLNHKKSLKVIQIWHASGAIKKFGLQSVGTKEGRDEAVSTAMCMHKNYDYILAPSEATAKHFMQAFGYGMDSFVFNALPRVDEVLTDTGSTSRFYRENPALSLKKIILYLPTFRQGEAQAVNSIKSAFKNCDMADYDLIISTHPLFSDVEIESEFSYNGKYSTYDLMKLADYIITDYSACAFEASVLMKPLYFYTPDYDEYTKDRGLNIDMKKELPTASFDDSEELLNSIKSQKYDLPALVSFKNKYMGSVENNNATKLALFIKKIINEA